VSTKDGLRATSPNDRVGYGSALVAETSAFGPRTYGVGPGRDPPERSVQRLMILLGGYRRRHTGRMSGTEGGAQEKDLVMEESEGAPHDAKLDP
jgi:hypothetical protein